MGRFLSEDPIGFKAGDMNLYRYVGNNPVMASDPSGNNPALLAGAAAGAFVGGINGAITSSACSFSGKVGDALIGATVGAIGGALAGLGQAPTSLLRTAAILFGGSASGGAWELVSLSVPNFSGHGCTPPKSPTPEPPIPPKPPKPPKSPSSPSGPNKCE